MLKFHTNTLTQQHNLRLCCCARCRRGTSTLALPGAACSGHVGRLAPFLAGCSAAPCRRNPSTNPPSFIPDRPTMTLTADTITPDAPDIEDQTVWISFRLTPAERAELKDHAHLARISVSELVRRRVLGLPEPKASVPQVNAQLRSDLAPVANNLNQLTKQVHQAGEVLPAHIQPLGRVLGLLKSLLDRVRLELIGAEQADDEGQE